MHFSADILWWYIQYHTASFITLGSFRALARPSDCAPVGRPIGDGGGLAPHPALSPPPLLFTIRSLT